MTNLDPTLGAFAGARPDSGRARDMRFPWAGRRSEAEDRAALPPMPASKRFFDVGVSLTLLLLIWPLLLVVAGLLLLKEGRPIFYLGERMSAPGRSFHQLKFRTMRVGADAVGGVTGGHKARAISPFQRFLRRSRIDELPQLVNVLRGEMSLVGPRPPNREYVEAYPEVYCRVLQSRPGLTGLATLRFHRYEERLLGACRTPEQTELAYRRICIPRKAKIDLIYQRNWSLWLDLRLCLQTARRPFYVNQGRRKTLPPALREPKAAGQPAE